MNVTLSSFVLFKNLMKKGSLRAQPRKKPFHRESDDFFENKERFFGLAAPIPLPFQTGF